MDEDDDDDNNVPDLADGDDEDPIDLATALPASIPDQMDHMADEAGWGPTRVALASTRLQSGEILSELAQSVVPAYPSTAGHSGDEWCPNVVQPHHPRCQRTTTLEMGSSGVSSRL
jgi:hypothetical protein